MKRKVRKVQETPLLPDECKYTIQEIPMKTIPMRTNVNITAKSASEFKNIVIVEDKFMDRAGRVSRCVLLGLG